MHRHRSVIRLAATLGVCLVFAAPVARASSMLEQTIVTGGSTYQFATFGGVFQQFDPALGTLQAVQLQFSGDVTYSVEFGIDPATCDLVDCSAEFSFSTGYSFNAPGFPLTNQIGGPFFTFANWMGEADLSNLDGQSSGALPISYSGNPDSLAGYIGTGTVDVDGGISEDSDYCNDNGIECTQFDGGALDLTTTLTYFYNRIPEPSSAWLLGAALAITSVVGTATRIMPGRRADRFL